MSSLRKQHRTITICTIAILMVGSMTAVPGIVFAGSDTDNSGNDSAAYTPGNNQTAHDFETNSSTLISWIGQSGDNGSKYPATSIDETRERDRNTSSIAIRVAAEDNTSVPIYSAVLHNNSVGRDARLGDDVESAVSTVANSTKNKTLGASSGRNTLNRTSPPIDGIVNETIDSIANNNGSSTPPGSPNDTSDNLDETVNSSVGSVVIDNRTAGKANDTNSIREGNASHESEESMPSTPDEAETGHSNGSVSTPGDSNGSRTDGHTRTDTNDSTTETQQSSVSSGTPSASDRRSNGSTPTAIRETTNTNTTTNTSANTTTNTSANASVDTGDDHIINESYPSTETPTDASIPPELNETDNNSSKDTDSETETHESQNASSPGSREVPQTPVPTPSPETGATVGVTAVAVRTIVRQETVTTGMVGCSVTTSGGLLTSIRAGIDTHVLDPLSRSFALFRYSRYDDSDPLKHEGRASVFETIEDTPGVYLSAVSQRTRLSLSSVRHHLRILEQESLVMSVKVHGKRRFYPTDSEQVELTAALNDEATANVIEALSRLGPASVSDLANDLDRDPSTVTHHLQRLDDDGIVHRERDGRTVINHLSENIVHSDNNT